ncbi:hypothetical protein ASG29_12420 [Sphingomonas sp. Leaf412]|uniref:LysR family transcriptional regulator n=1 Tax=Sphingomonas sp. Leaf412 TaxID=1736370 RepID=UPI0006FBC872|nr:LysR family transcriptional regulator [Sphingomonas sp. Leaf412]KQT32563.1 hypothetical protein ASG29_12420 [Sphingomonas sp. Leaf412]
MLDRQLLRYFIAVVDHGSFTRAAAACRVTQPTLSAGIARLEATLGEPVLTRSPRRVELTAAGGRLLVHARRIEGEFTAAETVATAPVRLVRLGIVSTLPGALVRRALAAASATGERIEVVDGRDRELVAARERGRIDAVLGPVEGGAALFEEGYAVALAAGHPLAGAARIAAEGIAGEPMIVRRHCEALSEVSRHFTSRGVRPFMAARTTNDDRALAFVAAGLGVTVMPECFADAGVALVPLEGFVRRRAIGLSVAPDSIARLRDSAAVAALAEVLRGGASPRT